MENTNPKVPELPVENPATPYDPMVPPGSPDFPPWDPDGSGDFSGPPSDGKDF